MVPSQHPAMPQNGSDEILKMMRGLPPQEGAGAFGVGGRQGRKAHSFGQPGHHPQQQQGFAGGEYDPMGGGHNPAMMMGGGDMGGPRPVWNSFDAGRALKLPPLEVRACVKESGGMGVEHAAHRPCGACSVSEGGWGIFSCWVSPVFLHAG